MSQKKSTTQKRTAEESKREQLREVNREQLAQDLADILNNPECPVGLRNAINEEVCDWSSYYCNAVNQTPDYIENCLIYFQRAKEERTEGGTR